MAITVYTYCTVLPTGTPTYAQAQYGLGLAKMWPDLASCCLDSAKEEILPAAQLDGLQGQDKSARVLCGLKVLIKVCIDMTIGGDR